MVLLFAPSLYAILVVSTIGCKARYHSLHQNSMFPSMFTGMSPTSQMTTPTSMYVPTMPIMWEYPKQSSGMYADKNSERAKMEMTRVPMGMSKHSIKYHKSPPTNHSLEPQTILVETAPQSPVNILFRSTSSSVNLLQDHKPSKNDIRHVHTHEEPIRMVLNITKPVIQEVNEVILPYRNVKQEIYPIKEFVETVIKTPMEGNNNQDKKEEEEANTEMSIDHYGRGAQKHMKTNMYENMESKSDANNQNEDHMGKLNNYMKYIQSEENMHSMNHGPDTRAMERDLNRYNVNSANSNNHANQNMGRNVMQTYVPISFEDMEMRMRQQIQSNKMQNQDSHEQTPGAKYGSPFVMEAKYHESQNFYQESQHNPTKVNSTGSAPVVIYENSPEPVPVNNTSEAK